MPPCRPRPSGAPLLFFGARFETRKKRAQTFGGGVSSPGSQGTTRSRPPRPRAIAMTVQMM